MAVREILTRGESALTKVCHPVTKFDQKLWDLIDDMKETLTQAGGVGLAAPQVGILRRVVIVINEADEVLELVGHPVGGVCPFGINEGVDVYLDESLKRFETVYPAVGSGASAIELNMDELWKYSNALEWIDVCKLPE